MNQSKVAISGRIHPDNYEWLKAAGSRAERSMNFILDKTLTEAREADEKAQEVDNADKH